MKEEDGGKGDGRLKENEVTRYVVCIMVLECLMLLMAIVPTCVYLGKTTGRNSLHKWFF